MNMLPPCRNYVAENIGKESHVLAPHRATFLHFSMLDKLVYVQIQIAGCFGADSSFCLDFFR